MLFTAGNYPERTQRQSKTYIYYPTLEFCEIGTKVKKNKVKEYLLDPSKSYIVVCVSAFRNVNIILIYSSSWTRIVSTVLK